MTRVILALIAIILIAGCRKPVKEGWLLDQYRQAGYTIISTNPPIVELPKK